MFRHIVVGADGSPEGHDAVALGAALAAIGGSELTLLRSFDPTVRRGPQVDPISRIWELEQRLNEDRQLYAPGAEITISAAPDAARALRSHALECGADLVVIGSSRQALSGRCAIGRTGRRLLGNVPAALAIATRGRRAQPHLATVAVGYDGGPEAELALQLADELAAAAAAELLIETIYEEPLAALVRGERSTPRLADELRESERRGAIAAAERAVARTAPRSHLSVCVGEPGLELRRASDDVDLTVIGSRRWGPSARTMLGGVGETLASDCGSCLLIARRASAPAPAPERLDRGAETGAMVPHS